MVRWLFKLTDLNHQVNCHVCSHNNIDVKKLNVRKWTCPQCGTRHDRDVNAVINIRNIGRTHVFERINNKTDGGKPFAGRDGKVFDSV